MRKICLVLSFLLVAVLWLLPVNTGLAKDVQHKFGSMRLPDNAYVIEYDFEKDVDKMDDKVRRQFKEFAKLINFYQISIDDGENYRTALAVTVFLDNELLRCGKDDLSDEQKKRLSFRYGDWQREEVERFQPIILGYLERGLYSGKNAVEVMRKSEIPKISFENHAKFIELPSGLISYEWEGVDTLKLNGEYGYKSRGRLAGYVAGLLLSGYFEVYTHNVRDNGVGVLVFVCVDSEREFWQPVFAGSVVQELL